MIQKLQGKLPNDIYLELQKILSNRAISAAQLSHLLANCEHECKWSKYEENLNYKPDRLLALFPKKVGTLVNAQQICSGGAQSIANFLYGGRMGNNTSGEGWKYRGRGCLQLTGKNNYVAFDATVPQDTTNNPELVSTDLKLTSAFWFFDVNKIWVAAAGNAETNIQAVRKKVNGGTIGLDDVRQLFQKYYTILA